MHAANDKKLWLATGLAVSLPVADACLIAVERGRSYATSNARSPIRCRTPRLWTTSNR